MTDRGALLARLLGHAPPRADGDGFGQSWIDDLRFAWRLRRLRRRPMAWRRPTRAEQAAILADPFLSRFADAVAGVAESGDLACVALERDRHGWPDAARYVLFALRGGSIAIAADFADWPPDWTLTPAPGPAD